MSQDQDKSQDMLDLLDGLEESPDEDIREHDICKCPFNYPGGKGRALAHILPQLPMRETYVEPFGGGAAILLARRPSRLEVYNDQYGGVVDFYTCLKDKRLCDELIAWLDLTVHSRELFSQYKNSWPVEDDLVTRAGMWYYVTMYSFGSLGRNFGRAVRPGALLSGRIRDKLVDFPILHERFKKVQIENQDWSSIFRDFDDYGTVFYVDPPYIDSYKGTYKYELTRSDHARLIETIMNCKGFVALSAYPNTLYDSYKWDNYIEWQQFVSLTGQATTETNNQTRVHDRSHTTEGLYIKEAQV